VDKRYLSVRIAKFLLLAVLIICSVQAQAFGEAAEEIDLEKIVVTNRRTAIGLSEATENVAVIDAEEIQKLPARDLGEALKYIAGIDLEPRQGFGRDTSVTVSRVLIPARSG
jgi:outer membrane cobalamin receptor